MKKILYSLALVSIITACSGKPEQKNNEQIKENNDSVKTAENTNTESKEEKPSRESLEKYFINDKGWIQVRNALSSDQTGIYIYFQATDDVAHNPRLRIQYHEAATYKFTIDGKLYTYKANKSQTANDARFVENNSTSWYDDSIKKDDLKFLEALVSSNDVQFSASGKVININEQTKKNIQLTLDYFEAMDGLLPKKQYGKYS